jgi:signal peptidase II
MVMGGALGNLVDRVRFGEVVDFLDFYIGTYHWPAFNVADSSISIGVSLLILYFIRAERRTGQPDQSPSAHA